MEKRDTCKVCGRMHEVGLGWAFCTGEDYEHVATGVLVSNSSVFLLSVEEREEAFWQLCLPNFSGDQSHFLNHAARFTLPCDGQAPGGQCRYKLSRSAGTCT